MSKLQRPCWFESKNAPKGLPSYDEITHLVDLKAQREQFAYPSHSPVCWIKYGRSIYWNEVLAQEKAWRGLDEIESAVRAPAVYFGYRCEYTTVIVMEYIRGRTIQEACVDAEPSQLEEMARKVAAALKDLIRIPISQSLRPSGVDRGRIRHTIFDEQIAPRHYENVRQLEEHLNLLLRRKPVLHTLRSLADEPMVFCFSDVHPTNFMINADGRTVVIDFADASILPASFSLYAVHVNRLGFDITQLVDVPGASVENVQALRVASGRITVGCSFGEMGKRIEGGDREKQLELKRQVEC